MKTVLHVPHCVVWVLANAEGRNRVPCARAIWLHVKRKTVTRGRARMLFEMLEGDVTKNGWKDEHVKESLDLMSCM